jgi:hypothetical protein
VLAHLAERQPSKLMGGVRVSGTSQTAMRMAVSRVGGSIPCGLQRLGVCLGNSMAECHFPKVATRVRSPVEAREWP